MNQEITQVKFSKEYDGEKFSVVCTQSNFNRSFWDCKFSHISLLNLVRFVVELFNCSTLSGADHLSLFIGNSVIGVDRCTENNTVSHYLEEIASELEF